MAGSCLLQPMQSLPGLLVPYVTSNEHPAAQQLADGVAAMGSIALMGVIFSVAIRSLVK